MFADWYYAYSVLYCFCYVFHYLWDASHPICLSLLAPLILYLKSLVKNFLLKSVHSINLVFKIFSILLDRLSHMVSHWLWYLQEAIFLFVAANTNGPSTQVLFYCSRYRHHWVTQLFPFDVSRTFPLLYQAWLVLFRLEYVFWYLFYRVRPEWLQQTLERPLPLYLTDIWAARPLLEGCDGVFLLQIIPSVYSLNSARNISKG